MRKVVIFGGGDSVRGRGGSGCTRMGAGCDREQKIRGNTCFHVKIACITCDKRQILRQNGGLECILRGCKIVENHEKSPFSEVVIRLEVVADPGAPGWVRDVIGSKRYAEIHDFTSKLHA